MDCQEKAVWDRVLQPRLPGWDARLQEQAEALERSYAALGHGALQELGRGSVQLLRGIALLEGWNPGKVPQGSWPGETDDLKGCYRRCRELMTAWALREPRPETGILYRQLGQLALEHCLLLARALGEEGAGNDKNRGTQPRFLQQEKRRRK